MNGTGAGFSSPFVEVIVGNVEGMPSRVNGMVFNVSSGASAEVESEEVHEMARIIPKAMMNERGRGCERERVSVCSGISGSKRIIVSAIFLSLVDTEWSAKRLLQLPDARQAPGSIAHEKKGRDSDPGPFVQGKRRGKNVGYRPSSVVNLS